MAVANAAQALALEHEKVRPDLPLFYQQDDTLWGKIKSRGDLVVVAGRPTRVPQELLAGGKFRSFNPDGGDAGLGSGVTPDVGLLVPTYFIAAWQYTKATEINTNSDEKAIESYVSLLNKRAMKQFNERMEAVIQGDGSNTLDTVTSTSGTTQINTNNANQFQDNQDIDVWSALGGFFRGTCTVLSADVGNNQLNLTGVFPGGTTVGDLMLVSGSAGVANSGLAGIKAYQVNSNTGSVMGLARSAYPGKLSTPTVNANSQALTPAMARRLKAQLQLALGIDFPESEDLVFHMGVDMAAAWENTGLQVTSVIQNQLSGSSSQDMLKKEPPKTFASSPTLYSIHATPGRIDGLCLKHWFRCENQPIDFYDVGGQTLFPTYGASGGISASTLFYLWTGVQIGNDNVRAGTYASNVPVPVGYFGH
jgi:hypothetical protein